MKGLGFFTDDGCYSYILKEQACLNTYLHVLEGRVLYLFISSPSGFLTFFCLFASGFACIYLYPFDQMDHYLQAEKSFCNMNIH